MILVKNNYKPICKIDSSALPILFIISIITTVNALPLIIPVISPITSLQKLANLSAFLVIETASLAPTTFSAAIALNGDSFDAVAATPSISNKIPTITITKTMIKLNINETLLSNDDDSMEKIAANPNLITALYTVYLIECLNLLFIITIQLNRIKIELHNY